MPGQAQRWWTFDRPVRRDPLFLVALAAAAIVLLTATSRLAATDIGWELWLWDGVGGAVATWFTASVILGTVRSVKRGYQGGSTSAETRAGER